MHHPAILKKYGLTPERLREIFTAAPETPNGEIRKKFEDRIAERIEEGVRVCAENSSLYQAVDMAWDSPPVGKTTIPLLLWAQGKIKAEVFAERIKDSPLANELIKKNDKGEMVVSLPRLYEFCITLTRSYVTRRLAAQTSRFANLWPYFRYEPRGVDMVSKLKAEVLSQRADIWVDQYNIRHLGTQLARDQLLYARSLAFPRCAWDKVTQWRPKAVNVEGSEVETESYVVREGLDFTNAHPTRCYWDLSAPLANINTDNGPAFIGYWDIVRFGTLRKGDYFNTDSVEVGSALLQLVQKHSEFFNYYTDPRVINSLGPKTDPSLENSAAAKVGVYTGNDDDRGVLLVQHFEKVNPKHEGICDYDCEIWLRFSVAGDGTVVLVEALPSIPACYGGMNENDSRVVNASMAMELLPYQDQLSNICSHMLQNLRTSMIQLWLLDTDSLEKETRDYIDKGKKFRDFFVEPHLLQYSSVKLKEMGIDDPGKAFRIIQANVSETIDTHFNAITRLLNIVDRLMILSPNELGQPAPREISAREVQEISNTTSSIHTFISDGIDEQRAAMKKVFYESLVTHGGAKVRVPAMGRYSVTTLEDAGFKPESARAVMDTKDGTQIVKVDSPIIGETRSLLFEYVFDSRDGAERTPNSQVAQTITQLIQFLTSNEAVAAAMGKRRLFELVNEAVRLSGSGVDFQLSLDEDEGDGIGGDDLVKQLSERLDALEQGLAGAAGGAAAVPPPEQAGEPQPPLPALPSLPGGPQSDPQAVLAVAS
jgi:hypothetical protein